MSMAEARPARRPVLFGAIVALLCLALDQVSKLWILHGTDLESGGRIALAPFAEFVLVWNRGISYGLFQQDADLGRWLLAAFQLGAAVLLSVWLARTARRLTAFGLALIIGGAIGNAIDRIAYGAVVDFVHLYVGNFSWYVFNIADAAIVAGIAVLLYDSFARGDGGKPRRSAGRAVR